MSVIFCNCVDESWEAVFFPTWSTSPVVLNLLPVVSALVPSSRRIWVVFHSHLSASPPEWHGDQDSVVACWNILTGKSYKIGRKFSKFRAGEEKGSKFWKKRRPPNIWVQLIQLNTGVCGGSDEAFTTPPLRRNKHCLRVWLTLPCSAANLLLTLTANSAKDLDAASIWLHQCCGGELNWILLLAMVRFRGFAGMFCFFWTQNLSGNCSSIRCLCHRSGWWFFPGRAPFWVPFVFACRQIFCAVTEELKKDLHLKTNYFSAQKLRCSTHAFAFSGGWTRPETDQ